MSEAKTEQIKTGGPAFPEGESWESSDLAGMRHYNSRGPLRPGMNMRQWYAGQAIAGLLANPEWFIVNRDEIVLEAFRIADLAIGTQWRQTDPPAMAPTTDPGGQK